MLEESCLRLSLIAGDCKCRMKLFPTDWLLSIRFMWTHFGSDLRILSSWGYSYLFKLTGEYSS